MRPVLTILLLLSSLHANAQNIELGAAGGVTLPTVRETTAQNVKAYTGTAFMVDVHSNIPLGRSMFFPSAGFRISLLSFEATEWLGQRRVVFKSNIFTPSINILFNYLIPLQPAKSIRLSSGIDLLAFPQAGNMAYETTLSYLYFNSVNLGVKYYLPIGNTYSPLSRFGTSCYLLQLSFILGRNRSPYSFFSKTGDLKNVK